MTELEKAYKKLLIDAMELRRAAAETVNDFDLKTEVTDPRLDKLAAAIKLFDARRPHDYRSTGV